MSVKTGDVPLNLATSGIRILKIRFPIGEKMLAAQPKKGLRMVNTDQTDGFQGEKIGVLNLRVMILSTSHKRPCQLSNHHHDREYQR